MIIRGQQMDVLNRVAVRKFELRMAEHLQRCFPAECGRLGEAGLQDGIRDGIKRAESHGFSLQRDVCKYIDLMFVFGRDYDCDPWAAGILADDTFDDPSLKMDRLFSAAKRQISGKAGSSLP